MTTFLIVYVLSAVCMLAWSIHVLKNSGIKTVQIKEIFYVCGFALLPVVNAIFAISIIIKIVDEYDKELKNPFYKENNDV